VFDPHDMAEEYYRSGPVNGTDRRRPYATARQAGHAPRRPDTTNAAALIIFLEPTCPDRDGLQADLHPNLLYRGTFLAKIAVRGVGVIAGV
jgi:hypothetical protein